MDDTEIDKGIPKTLFPLALAGVAGIVAAVYWSVLEFGFVNFDDTLYVTENARTQAGLSWVNVCWAFTSVSVSNWHPLTWLSHMLDVQLFGMNPAGHHAVSMLFHVANTVLLLLWLNRILRREEGTVAHSTCLSVLIVLLFAVHPLRVESVAWVSERKDVLCGFFWLLALLAYDAYACKPTAARYVGVLLAFLLGLMSKSMVVTLPIVFLLLDYWPLRRFSRPGGSVNARSFALLVLEKIPLLLLAGAVGLGAFLTQRSGTTMADLATIPLSLRIENAVVSYVRYVGITFWPRELAAFYPYPRAGLPAVSVVFSGLLLVFVTGIALAWRRRMPYLLVGWLWYLVTLLPVIGVIQIGAQALADRYTYLPGIGLLLAVVLTTWEMIRPSRLLRMGYAFVAILLLVLLCLATRHQLGFWRDSVSLWSRAIDVTEGNWRAHYNLGNTYFQMKRRADAAQQYSEAVRIDPNHYNARANLGTVLCQLGRVPEGIEQLRAATQLKPSNPEFHKLLAAELLKTGQNDEAAAHLEEALGLGAAGVDIRMNLAIAFANVGKYSQAETQLREILRASPDNGDARFNLGNLYLLQNRYSEAVECFSVLSKSRPDDADVRYGLATALSNVGKNDDALVQADEVLRIRPDHEGARRLVTELKASSVRSN